MGDDVTIEMYVPFISPPDVLNYVIIFVVLPQKPVCKLNSERVAPGQQSVFPGDEVGVQFQVLSENQLYRQP